MGQSKSKNTGYGSSNTSSDGQWFSDRTLIKMSLSLTFSLFVLLLVTLLLGIYVFTPEGTTFIDNKITDINNNVKTETDRTIANQTENTAAIKTACGN